jgi:hypothetical protein
MPIPDSAWREREGLSNGTRHKPLWRANPKALVNAAKFASALSRIPGSMRRLNCIDNRLILKCKFYDGFFAAIGCGQVRPIIADEESCRYPALSWFRPNQSAVRAVDLTDIRPTSVAGGRNYGTRADLSFEPNRWRRH